LKIVAIIPSLSIGGAERSLVKLVQVIFPMTSGIDIFCLTSGHPDVLKELPVGVNVRFFNAKSSASPLTFLRIRRELRRIGPDIVLGWSLYANFLAVVVARSLNIHNVVISERVFVPSAFDEERDASIRRWLVLSLIRWLYPKAATVTANSSSCIRFLRKFAPGAAKYRLLPNIIDIAHVTRQGEMSLEKPLPLTSGPRILAVGRLDRQKGFDLLIQALALVRRSHDWSIVIVGDGPERDALRLMAKSLGVSGYIHWVGANSSPFPFYRWSQIVVAPSRFEGFPNVMMEAMAIGRAVVCTDCKTGPRELSRGGKFAILMKGENPHALATAIIEVGESAQVFTRLGAAARAHVSENYDTASGRSTYAEVFGLLQT